MAPQSQVGRHAKRRPRVQSLSAADRTHSVPCNGLYLLVIIGCLSVVVLFCLLKGALACVPISSAIALLELGCFVHSSYVGKTQE